VLGAAGAAATTAPLGGSTAADRAENFEHFVGGLQKFGSSLHAVMGLLADSPVKRARDVEAEEFREEETF
jgi:hypothetical protein